MYGMTSVIYDYIISAFVTREKQKHQNKCAQNNKFRLLVPWYPKEKQDGAQEKKNLVLIYELICVKYIHAKKKKEG